MQLLTIPLLSPSKEEIKQKILRKGNYSADAYLLARICWAESGFENKRGYAQNSDGSYDHGVCQLNDRWHLPKVGGTIQGFYDIDKNIDAAYQIRRDWGNFTAWSVYTNGRYLNAPF